MTFSRLDKKCFQKAISQAFLAEESGNLPIGAVIALNGKIIAESRNAIWKPETSLTKHAEMETMRSVPSDMWDQAAKMTLHTTLEPCLMCMGAILLHGIGRVLYGSNDPYGGATSTTACLPPFFARQFSKTIWSGPVFQEECDKLYERIKKLEHMKDVFREE
jgi:tRNA(adenine34) deaminase